MADSTLDPARDRPAQTPKGHGTKDLGPSGTSDSGSDLRGPGLADDPGLHFDTGTTSDDERSRGASHDVGDANPDSDTDESDTGKRSTAGRDDDTGEARDIAPDRLIGSELPMPADALDRMVVEDDTAGDEDPGDHTGANDSRRSR